MACDANDLAHAAARAGIHGGTPVSDGCFGARTAALAEDFGHRGHQHSASDSHVPLPPWHTPGLGNLVRRPEIPGANLRKRCAAELALDVPLAGDTGGRLARLKEVSDAATPSSPVAARFWPSA